MNLPFPVHFGSNSFTLKVVHTKSLNLSGERSIEVKDIAEEKNCASECIKILSCYMWSHVISKRCAKYYDQGLRFKEDAADDSSPGNFRKEMTFALD